MSTVRCRRPGTILHGFNSCPQCHLTVAWGGRIAEILVVEKAEALRSSRLIDAPDWILSALVIGLDCSKHDVALLMAHNGLVRYSCATGEEQLRVASRPPVLLYSGHLQEHGRDGLLATVGTMDGRAFCWSTNNPLLMLQECRFDGSALCIAGLGTNCLVVGSDDRSVRIFVANECQKQIRTKLRPWAVVWQHNGDLIVGGEDGMVQWSSVQEGGSVDERLFVSRSDVRRLAVSSDDQWVAAGCDDGTLAVFQRPEALPEPERYLVGNGKIRMLHVAGNGNVYSACNESVFCNQELVFKGNSAVIFMGISEVSGDLVVAHRDGSISNGVKLDAGLVGCCLKESFMLVCWFDSFAVLELGSGKLLLARQSWPLARKESITAWAFSVDSTGAWTAAVGSSDGSIGIAINDSQETMLYRSKHRSTVTGLWFQSERLYSSCRDGRIGIWQVWPALECISLGRPRCVRRADSVEGFENGMARIHWGGQDCLFASIDLGLETISSVVARIPGVLPRALVSVNRTNAGLTVAAVLSGKVCVWRWQTPPTLPHILYPPSHAAAVNAMALRGEQLVSVGDDGRWGLWDASRNVMWGKSGHSLRAVAWMASGESFILASASHLFVYSASGQLTGPPVEFAPEWSPSSSQRCMWVVVTGPEHVCIGDSAGNVRRIHLTKGLCSFRAVDGHCLEAACGTEYDDEKVIACVSSRGTLHYLSSDSLLPVLSSLCLTEASLLCVCSWKCGVICAGDDPNVGYWVTPSSSGLSVVPFRMHHSAAIVALVEKHGMLYSLSKDQHILQYDAQLKLLADWTCSVTHPNCLQISSSGASCVGGANGIFFPGPWRNK